MELIAVALPFLVGIPSVFLWKYWTAPPEKPKMTQAEALNNCKQYEASWGPQSLSQKSEVEDIIKLHTQCLCLYPVMNIDKGVCEQASKPRTPVAYDYLKGLTYKTAKFSSDVAYLCSEEAAKNVQSAQDRGDYEIECRCRHPLDRIDIAQCAQNRKSERH